MKKWIRCFSFAGAFLSLSALLFSYLLHSQTPVLRFRDELYEIKTQNNVTVYTHESDQITQNKRGNIQTIFFDLEWLSKRTYAVWISGDQVHVTDMNGTVLLSGTMHGNMLYHADGSENLEYSHRLHGSSTGNTMYEANSKLPPSAVEALALAQGRFNSTRTLVDCLHASELTFLFAFCSIVFVLTLPPRRGILFLFLKKSGQ